MIPDISSMIPPPPVGPRKVVFFNVRPVGAVLKDGPSKRWSIGFVLATDEGRFLGTVLSNQSPKKLKRIIQRYAPCVVEGAYLSCPVIGPSGEKYHPVFGTITPMEQNETKT